MHDTFTSDDEIVNGGRRQYWYWWGVAHPLGPLMC